MNYSAIILAGGKSSRMKYNKEYIKVNDTFLVHNQIMLLSSIFDEIIVVSPNIDHYSDFNVKVVQDILPGSTPLIGLHSGLLASTNPYCYVIACDMPYINLDYIKYLIKTHKLKEALVTMNNGFIEPFNAIYSTNITSNIENFISTKKYGFQTFISTLDKDILSEKESSNFNPKIMFKNINTESDLIENFNEFAPITQSFNITKVQQNEIYSIDEAFLDLDRLDKNFNLYQFGCYVRGIIKQWTGVPVRVGIAPTKTLTKVAIYQVKKKNVATRVVQLITPKEIAEALSLIP